jgi:hypothetical protein
MALVMQAFLSRVEVQRVLLVTFGLWMLAGAYLFDPLWLVVVRAAGASVWTFLLAWSFTLGSAVARVARIAIGAGLVTGCAATFGASAPALLAVAAVAGAVLAGCERLMRRHVAA